MKPSADSTGRSPAGRPPARIVARPCAAIQEKRLAQRVSRDFRVDESVLFAAGRSSARASLARHVAMYLMHVVLGRSYTDIGVCFGRHRTTVLYACARIEDRRDDKAFDRRIAYLERQIDTRGPDQ